MNAKFAACDRNYSVRVDNADFQVSSMQMKYLPRTIYREQVFELGSIQVLVGLMCRSQRGQDHTAKAKS